MPAFSWWVLRGHVLDSQPCDIQTIPASLSPSLELHVDADLTCWAGPLPSSFVTRRHFPKNVLGGNSLDWPRRPDDLGISMLSRLDGEFKAKVGQRDLWEHI
jgi:hypothetical protein